MRGFYSEPVASLRAKLHSTEGKKKKVKGKKDMRLFNKFTKQRKPIQAQAEQFRGERFFQKLISGFNMALCVCVCVRERTGVYCRYSKR